MDHIADTNRTYANLRNTVVATKSYSVLYRYVRVILEVIENILLKESKFSNQFNGFLKQIESLFQDVDDCYEYITNKQENLISQDSDFEKKIVNHYRETYKITPVYLREQWSKERTDPLLRLCFKHGIEFYKEYLAFYNKCHQNNYAIKPEHIDQVVTRFCLFVELFNTRLKDHSDHEKYVFMEYLKEVYNFDIYEIKPRINLYQMLVACNRSYENSFSSNEVIPKLEEKISQQFGKYRETNDKIKITQASILLKLIKSKKMVTNEDLITDLNLAIKSFKLITIQDENKILEKDQIEMRKIEVTQLIKLVDAFNTVILNKQNKLDDYSFIEQWATIADLIANLKNSDEQQIVREFASLNCACPSIYLKNYAERLIEFKLQICESYEKLLIIIMVKNDSEVATYYDKAVELYELIVEKIKNQNINCYADRMSKLKRALSKKQVWRELSLGNVENI